MDAAIVVFSRKGIFQTTIAAHAVRSREHARKLWPLGECEHSCGVTRPLAIDCTESQSAVGFAGLFRGAEEGKDGKHSNRRSA